MRPDNISIQHAEGYSRNGMLVAYVRPTGQCSNRPRKVKAVSSMGLSAKIDACIVKYFYPLNYYNVNGFVFGSNCPDNALKEYYRVCNRSDTTTIYKPSLI